MDILKITDEDLKLLEKLNLTELDAIKQFNFVKQKKSLIDLIKPCNLNDGIIDLTTFDKEDLFNNFSDLISQNKLKKFVPASGASSRMFAFVIKSNFILKNIFDLLLELDSKELKSNLLFNLTPKDLKTDLNDYFLNEFVEFKNFILNLNKFPLFLLLPAIFKTQILNKENLFIELEKEYNNLFDKLNEMSFLILLTDFILYDQISTKYLQFFENKNELKPNIKGLGYSNLPKGLIPFHLSNDNKNTFDFVTAFEEHIIENEKLISNKNLNSIVKIKIEFSININYLNNFQNIINKLNLQNTIVEFSEQYLNTNSLAFDEKNSLVKTLNGELLLRAGGHGALLYNIQKISEPFIFIRNIDNIPNDLFQNKFNENVKLIVGFAKIVKEKIDKYLHNLENNKIDSSYLNEIVNFVNIYLYEDYFQKTKEIDDNTKINLLILLLDRPLRVAAMVKNTGEPGGGPFYIHNSINQINELDKLQQMYNSLNSKQIVELSQINKEKYSNIINLSNYFNPVFLVANFTKYDDSKYELEKYKDNNMGMIVEKEYYSQKIKSYEYPGLWNASMANWNTIFVDLGDELFFPVKTVNDLIKKGHNS